MSTVQRVAKNTGVVLAGDLIFRAISLIVTIYLARYLGTVGFGKYNFVFAYLAFFSIITDLGLQKILVRTMSCDKLNTPKLIGNAYIIRLTLTIFAVLLAMVTITLMSYPADTTTYVYIAAFTLLFVSFSDFYATIFQANLRMEYNMFAKLVFRVLSAGLILWIIFSHGTLMQIMIVLVFSEMVKTLINYSFSRKFVKPRFDFDFEQWKYLLKESFPIAISSVIFVIYFRIDVVMLSIMEGDIPVGLYSAAYKLSEPLILISSALMMSVFPIMSASFKNLDDRLLKSYRFAIKYIFIVALPMAMGTTLIADKIILLIYGNQFADSISSLQILIWALVFTSITPVLTHLLTATGKQKLNTLSSALCAVLNIILNFILIPILSYNGAAIATVISSIIFFISSFYFVSKHIYVLPVHKIFIKPVISVLFMGAFVYYFNNLNIFLLVFLAIIVYSVMLLALKTFNKEDKALLKKIIGKAYI